MAIQTSKQLFARRQELANTQASLMTEGNEDEARIVEGQIREIDRTLDHVLDEEERVRAQYEAAPKALVGFGEQILGPRDSFAGLSVGFKNDGDAATPASVAVKGPQEIDYTLPEKQARLLSNFASTLLSVPAAGSVTFKQRSAQEGMPATWSGPSYGPEGDGTAPAKAKVVYTWKDAVANKETVAGYVPVSKDTLRDYDELLAIIEHDLLIDLDEVENAKYLTGTNSSGIVGVLNTTGIQVYSSGHGGLYWEAIRHMRNTAMKNARTVPTHVVMYPDIKLAIDLYKDQNDRYQALDGWWGMVPIEDFDCPGIMVYDQFAARKRPVHNTTVEVGYYNDQFIKNELSLLAERTSCLQVMRPDAFVYATKTALDA